MSDDDFLFEEDFEEEDEQNNQNKVKLVIGHDNLFPADFESETTKIIESRTESDTFPKKNENSQDDKENQVKFQKVQKAKKKKGKKSGGRLRNENNSVNWNLSHPYFDSIINNLKAETKNESKKRKLFPNIGEKTSSFNEVSSRSLRQKSKPKKRKGHGSKRRKKRVNSAPKIIEEEEKKEIQFMKNRMTKLYNSTSLKDQIRVLEMERIQREGKFSSLVVDEKQIKFLKTVEGMKKSMQPSKKKQEVLKQNVRLLQKKNEMVLDPF